MMASPAGPFFRHTVGLPVDRPGKLLTKHLILKIEQRGPGRSSCQLTSEYTTYGIQYDVFLQRPDQEGKPRSGGLIPGRPASF